MNGPLARVGHLWGDFVDTMLDWQADLLRRTAYDMADALDRAAQRDIEGASEWRDLNPKENRYAG